jgi:UDP-2-acetamido-3-amino-2,3-dideoxy-glucuronate N-acetyltransferase
VIVYSFTNLYGCRIGDETRIGPFVEVSVAAIGSRCKIQSHTFGCEGVTIEDGVFVGHGVLSINDNRPRATGPDGQLLGPEGWTLEPTTVERSASIGSGAVLLGGIRVGAGAMIGAGAVVTRNVEPGGVVAGVPARTLAGSERACSAR